MDSDSLKEWINRYSKMSFFLPKFEDDPKSEEYYNQIKGFADKTDCPHTNSRVCGIYYELNDGTIETVTVGLDYKNIHNVPVVAILESSILKKVYYIVLAGRGLPNINGEIEPPIYQEAIGVIYFED